MKEDHNIEDWGIYKRLQYIYKIYPHAPREVINHVGQIRSEFDRITEEMQKKFEYMHENLTVEYLQKELDYLEMCIKQGKMVENQSFIRRIVKKLQI